jgi:hypothetical protein
MHGTVTSTLITEIKSLIAKGDTASDRANEFYKEAGLKLMKLRNQHKSKKLGGTWEEYVKAEFGLSYHRAWELMRIAQGKSTITKQRERAKQGMRKSRAKTKPLSRYKGSIKPVPAGMERVQLHDLGTGKKKWVTRHKLVDDDGSACNFDYENAKDFPDEADVAQRARAMAWQLHEGLRLTRDFRGLKTESADELTDEIISEAQTVADAWADLIKQLRRRKKELADGKKTNSATLSG